MRLISLFSFIRNVPEKQIFLSIFFFLFFLSPVLSIGMSPPDVYADYVEGTTYEFVINIVNNAHSGSSIQMSASGEYSDLMVFSETNFKFKRDELYHPVTVTITLPDYNDLTVFGKNKIYIRASEGFSSESTGMFSVTTAITGWFVIDIPIPGKYAVIDSFVVSNAIEGFDAPFSLTIKNRGTQSLSGLSAKIYLSNYQGDILDSVLFNNIRIPVDDSYILTDILPVSEYSSSKYFALVEVTFDADKVPSSYDSSFFVGSTDIELLSYTKNISSNTINKINLELQSLWGSPLKNIRGVIEFDGVSQKLPVLDFSSFERKDLDAYIDLPEVNKSTLDAIVTFTIPVDEVTESTKVIPLTFNIIQESKPGNESPLGTSSLMIVGLIFIVLLLVGVNVFIFMSRKHSKKK